MEIEIGAILRALRKWFWVPLILMVSLGVVAYGIASERQNVYTATATLVVEFSAGGAPDATVSSITVQLADTYKLLLETDEFKSRIASQAGLQNVEDFELQIVIPPGSRYLDIDVTHTDAAAALNVANATVDVIIIDFADKSEARLDDTTNALNSQIESMYAERGTLSQEVNSLEESDETDLARLQQLNSEISRLDQRIDETEARVDRMRLDYQLNEPGLVPIKFNVPPTDPDNVSPELIALLGAFLGALLGAAFIIFWAFTNNTLSSTDQWQDHSDARVLSEIPHAGQLGESGQSIFLLADPTAAPAEGIRMSVAAMDFAGFPTEDKKVIQVTSPGPSDGKSTLSANLAVHYSQLGKRVLLVDCDLHRPRLHSFFSVSQDNGLTSLLMNRETRVTDIAARVALPGLFFLPSGPLIPNPAELFSSVHFEAAVKRFREEFDVVILDTPPILLFSDTRRIASQSDAIIAIGRLNQTKVPDMVQTLEAIEATGTELLGTIWIGSKPSKNHYYYRNRRKRGRFF